MEVAYLLPNLGSWQDIVVEVQAKSVEEEAYGRSTKRYLDNARLDAKLPEGAEWCTVKVKYHG